MWHVLVQLHLKKHISLASLPAEQVQSLQRSSKSTMGHCKVSQPHQGEQALLPMLLLLLCWLLQWRLGAQAASWILLLLLGCSF
jgi:hypothetical protein